MKILINEEIPLSKWDSLVKKNLYGSPFQTIEYFSFFNSVPGYSAIAVAIEDNEILEALIVVTIQHEPGLKSFFSRRAIIYGGPLLAHEDSNIVEILLKEINRIISKKVIYAETRNFFNYSKLKRLFENAGWYYQPYFNYQLDCKSKEKIWSNLNTNRKRQIKKAIKVGTTFNEAESIIEVDLFYKILRDLYKNKIRKPLPDKRFFFELFDKQLAKFLLVKLKGEVIGGIVCPFLSNKAIYEFYICGLDKDFREASPSVMATFAALQYGCMNNIAYFDFMGAGKPDEDYGVRDFKAKFGGQLVEYGRYIKVYNSFFYSAGSKVLTVMQGAKK